VAAVSVCESLRGGEHATLRFGLTLQCGVHGEQHRGGSQCSGVPAATCGRRSAPRAAVGGASLARVGIAAPSAKQHAATPGSAAAGGGGGGGQDGGMTHSDLMAGLPPTLLPDDPAARGMLEEG